MCARFTLISILTVVLIGVTIVYAKKKIKVKQGPGGMSLNDSTTCVEFSKNARFNPYSVLFERWFVFYYWSRPLPLLVYVFTYPTANHTKYLHRLLDGKTILPVDWSARHILMENQENETTLLVERSDRGEYWRYPLYKVTDGRKIKPRDVRFKQTGDNRILGFMICDDETVLVMSRLNDVPPKKHLQDEAARIGYRSRSGKSYLYQGHDWMPIPEDDEENYWYREKKSKGSKTSSNEVKSSEQSSEEIASENNNTQKIPEETLKNTSDKIEDTKSNKTEESEEKENTSSEKSSEKKNKSSEKSTKKENNTSDKKYENEENAPDDDKDDDDKDDDDKDDDDNEDDIKKSHKSVMVDENQLKATCIEILPEPWDEHEEKDATKKPETLLVTKEYLDRESVKIIETTEFTQALDSTLSTKITENTKEMNNKLQTQQDKNESNTPKDKSKDDSNNIESTQSTNELQNQCQDCSEYVKSTDKPYVPINAHTSKYLDNTKFTKETVSSSSTEPVTSRDLTESTPNTTNEPVSPHLTK